MRPSSETVAVPVFVHKGPSGEMESSPLYAIWIAAASTNGRLAWNRRLTRGVLIPRNPSASSVTCAISSGDSPAVGIEAMEGSVNV